MLVASNQRPGQDRSLKAHLLRKCLIRSPPLLLLHRNFEVMQEVYSECNKKAPSSKIITVWDELLSVVPPKFREKSLCTLPVRDKQINPIRYRFPYNGGNSVEAYWNM